MTTTTTEKPVLCPFTVAIDVQEKQPFSFTGLAADADRKRRLIEVPTIWKPLGVARGDYSISGLEASCGIERKSLEDAHGTILGWGDRRERFTRELETLATLACSAVVLECTLNQLIESAPQHGVKPAETNAKILFRQVLAWQQDFRVPWIFCDGRRMAEIVTFRLLERYWRKVEWERKQAEKQLESSLQELVGPTHS